MSQTHFSCPQNKLLIVDDEKNTRDGLEAVFSENFDVLTASNAEEAILYLRTEKIDVVITDLRMGHAGNGLEVIDVALKLPQRPICIMMTAYGSIETAVQAIKRGAYDFLSKPIQIDKLEAMVYQALRERNKQASPQKTNEVVGHSAIFQRILEQVQTVAPTRANILITGETGTGKEVIAHQIHQQSKRAHQPFVAVHCAALPTNLLESELFGYEKGAFTGAIQRHIGRFEMANKGTLFLDEIGEIDANTQVKLLRFLETRTLERIGSTQSISVDIRLVCATHKNLKEEVAAGRFREDLYYRLNVVEIHLPALRERKEDIVELLKHYLKVFAKENDFNVPEIPEEIAQILTEYRWPGNIRELRNFAENIIVLHRGNPITREQLDAKFFVTANPTTHSSIKDQERTQILNALQQCDGNKTKAAEVLGIPRRTLYRKLESYHLN